MKSLPLVRALFTAAGSTFAGTTADDFADPPFLDLGKAMNLAAVTINGRKVVCALAFPPA